MNSKWAGPFQIRRLLRDTHTRSFPRPPEVGSAYLVTRRGWRNSPAADSKPLYVGGITGRSLRFRTRVGDLLADMLGFFGTGRSNGHHSGGKSLHRWCRRENVNPMDLHLAWVKRTNCHRCLEVNLVSELKPLLNRKAPARCKIHG